jgi:hypothetical protein
MGVENNECIIATTWDEQSVNHIKKWIKTLSDDEKSLFCFIPALVNHKTTIILAPDGSKKGWDIADRIEQLRDSFYNLLKSFNYEDGSNPFDFIEVGFGEYGQKVLRGNCENKYNDKDYYN